MSFCVVLNHHSLPFINKADALKNAISFIETVLALRQFGLHVLLCDPKLGNLSEFILVDPSYNIGQLLKDTNLVDTESKTLFKSTVTKSLLSDEKDILSASGIEIMLEDNEQDSLICLVAAHIKDTFLISFKSSELWCNSEIIAYKRDIAKDANLNTIEKISIPNLFALESIKDHHTILYALKKDFLKNAKDIVTYRKTCFPDLVLLEDEICRTLMHWSAGETILAEVATSLEILNKFAKKLKSDEFKYYKNEHLIELGLSRKVSDESESTKNNPKLMQARRAVTRDGYDLVFTRHISLSSGFRLYFHVDNSKKIVYVGYLGPHLPTKKY